jgi:acyl-CoA synthetase (NDP forming)
MPADYGADTVTVSSDAVEIAQATGTLLLPVWMSPRRGGGYEVLHEAGMAPFDGVQRAVKALKRFAQWRNNVPGPTHGARKAADTHEFHQPKATSDRALTYEQSKELLSAAGVRVPRESFVTDAHSAAGAVERLGNRVAMKLSAPGLIHKTEVGGVRLDIRGGQQAAAVFDEMTSSERLAPFAVEAEGVLVQEMVAEGVDLLVSAHEDEVFGPILTIGAGGVATEIELDVAHLAISFSDEELVRALRGLRLWPHLEGYRGKPGTDIAVLARTVRAIADVYVAKARSIAEIEINPLRVIVDASKTECVALDVVVLRR